MKLIWVANPMADGMPSRQALLGVGLATGIACTWLGIMVASAWRKKAGCAGGGLISTLQPCMACCLHARRRRRSPAAASHHHALLPRPMHTVPPSPSHAHAAGIPLSCRHPS